MRGRTSAGVAGLLSATAVVWALEGRTMALALLASVLLLVSRWWRRRPAVRRVRRRRVWTDEERRFILDRDGWQCVYCGSKDELEIDHIVPFSKGGACSVTNSQTLCRSCNARKGAS